MERRTNADSNMIYSMGDSNFAKNRLISQAIETSSPTVDSENDQRSRRLGSRVDRVSKVGNTDFKTQFEQFQQQQEQNNPVTLTNHNVAVEERKPKSVQEAILFAQMKAAGSRPSSITREIEEEEKKGVISEIPLND